LIDIVCFSEKKLVDAEPKMSRLSFALLLVTSLVLTVYFGAAAWRLTDDGHMDITGHIPPAAK
jgi:hypothetical protein